MSNKKLSAQEQRLYDEMNGVTVGTDIPITQLFVAVFDEEIVDFRSAQQRLGGCVSKVNRKVTTHKIEPGKVKRTYRMVARISASI